METIELLQLQREGLNMSNPTEYSRLTARIRWLRDREGVLEYNRKYRAKNAGRMRYERLLVPRQVRVKWSEMTQDQRDRRMGSIRRWEAKSPSRVARRCIERNFLLTYNLFSLGKMPSRCRSGKGLLKSEVLLGCGLEEFRAHIEGQLLRYGWGWGDWREKWTMDHVVPVRKFKLPEEKLSCWHYTNLRPMPKHLNNSRGCKSWI